MFTPFCLKVNPFSQFYQILLFSDICIQCEYVFNVIIFHILAKHCPHSASKYLWNVEMNCYGLISHKNQMTQSYNIWLVFFWKILIFLFAEFHFDNKDLCGVLSLAWQEVELNIVKFPVQTFWLSIDILYWVDLVYFQIASENIMKITATKLRQATLFWWESKSHRFSSQDSLCSARQSPPNVLPRTLCL